MRPVHGPIARTTASPCNVWLAVHHHARGRAIAARHVLDDADVKLRAPGLAPPTRAAVNRAGVTCAVVSVEPSVAVTMPEPSSQRGAATRWPPASAPRSRAASMNVSMRR